MNARPLPSPEAARLRIAAFHLVDGDVAVDRQLLADVLDDIARVTDRCRKPSPAVMAFLESIEAGVREAVR